MHKFILSVAVCAPLVMSGPAFAIDSVLDAIETAGIATGPSSPEIPPETLARANAMAIAAIETAESDADTVAALTIVARLARFGDQPARWALMRNYHSADATSLRGIVTPSEITRFGLDLLLAADPSMDKLDSEFTLAMSQIAVDGHLDDFAESFVAMLREDDRLSVQPVLGDILMALVFIPGACDATIERAIAEGARELTTGGHCGAVTVRDGFLAFAERAEPSTVEATARQKAAAELRAMTVAAPLQ